MKGLIISFFVLTPFVLSEGGCESSVEVTSESTPTQPAAVTPDTTPTLEL